MLGYPLFFSLLVGVLFLLLTVSHTHTDKNVPLLGLFEQNDMWGGGGGNALADRPLF